MTSNEKFDVNKLNEVIQLYISKDRIRDSQSLIDFKVQVNDDLLSNSIGNKHSEFPIKSFIIAFETSSSGYGIRDNNSYQYMDTAK